MIRILSTFFALYWAVLFVLFVVGVHEPDNVGIAIAMLQSALAFVVVAVDQRK